MDVSQVLMGRLANVQPSNNSSAGRDDRHVVYISHVWYLTLLCWKDLTIFRAPFLPPPRRPFPPPHRTCWIGHTAPLTRHARTTHFAYLRRKRDAVHVGAGLRARVRRRAASGVGADGRCPHWRVLPRARVDIGGPPVLLHLRDRHGEGFVGYCSVVRSSFVGILVQRECFPLRTSGGGGGSKRCKHAMADPYLLLLTFLPMAVVSVFLQ